MTGSRAALAALWLLLPANGAGAFDLAEIQKRGTLRVLAVVSGAARPPGAGWS